MNPESPAAVDVLIGRGRDADRASSGPTHQSTPQTVPQVGNRPGTGPDTEA